MKFVADLHLHSKYSRAVSQDMTFANMALWSKYKGIDVLGTGDFTHPFWFEQLKNELDDAGNGLYKLKSTVHRQKQDPEASVNREQRTENQLSVNRQPIYFLLSCEVSSIYSQGGKTRRIHNLFFFPTLASVEKFNQALIRRGANLRSDGRPIVGMSSRDLVEIALSCDEKGLVVPAHAWTPWFSVFGSFSGFDSIEECFGDMSEYICGIETGLSSDPAMNWQIGDLDGRAILSFSDAHSLAKMGREATVFEAEEISYDSIYEAIKNVSKVAKVTKVSNVAKVSKASKTSETFDTSETFVPPKIAFTIEFHPEEGKYHFTGHRDCNFSQGPDKYVAGGNICPKCGRPLTVGVVDRVKQLKTRDQLPATKDQDGMRWVYPEGNSRPPYVSLVPLHEILVQVTGAGPGTKKITDIYASLIRACGNEFNVLLKANLDQIKRVAGPRVGEGIDRVRRGNIVVEPGYDGKFGVVKIWSEGRDVTGDRKSEETQLNLFA